MKKFFIYDSKIGTMLIAERSGKITDLSLAKEMLADQIEETPLLKEAYRQVSEYLAGRRKDFDLPLAPEGTAFQQQVWQALQQIPYGKTCSYGAIAAGIGNAKASRAVGMANQKNPILLVIPCHRVIGADGSLTGYNAGLPLKKLLLDLEKENA